jgi:cell division protein FtsA
VVRFLGAGATPSMGWSKGRISDSLALTECVKRAVSEAESQAGLSVPGVTVGVGGCSVQGMNSRGLYEFGRAREIEPGDLGYAVELASRVRLHEDRVVLHVCPQEFIVDGRAGYRNPKGAMCTRLEANAHVVVGSAHEHATIVTLVHKAHLGVEETVFEPIAAGYACVVQQDRARGVAIVDIGAQSSDMVVYDGDALVLAASLPVGGEHFTRDVAFGLTLTFEDAERLKCECGCAILGLTSDSTLIELPEQEGRPAREASRKMLNSILEARAEDLFDLVRSELNKVGMDQNLLEGIVLTGGGALLNGMCDMAERVLNCQARNGLAIGVAHWPGELDAPEWATAAGLSMYSARLKYHRDTRKRVPGLMGLVLGR